MQKVLLSVDDNRLSLRFGCFVRFSCLTSFDVFYHFGYRMIDGIFKGKFIEKALISTVFLLTSPIHAQNKLENNENQNKKSILTIKSTTHAPQDDIQNRKILHDQPIALAFIEGLSGVFAGTGESVYRNLLWAVEDVNARGGVKVGANVYRPLKLVRYDSKGQNDEALLLLKQAIDEGAQFIVQGNSSATAQVIVDALNKHNTRESSRAALFLNYSAVEPSLTNGKCSFWHFRFDAHADMRLQALMQVIKEDKTLSSVYLIGQDYSFGQNVLKEAALQLGKQRPDVRIVGNELHPLAKVKDFVPYALKIKNSGAQAVVTGNWGNDLTLLIKAAKEVGFEGKFYTFYGNALGAPAAIGDAGIGKVIAVADWLPNLGSSTLPNIAIDEKTSSDLFVKAFRTRYPDPREDYQHMRMRLMINALVKAIESTKSNTKDNNQKNSANSPINVIHVAQALEQVKLRDYDRSTYMRSSDHQFQQPLVVGVMEKHGASGVRFAVEGSGYGFRVIRYLNAEQAQMPTTCQMPRP